MLEITIPEDELFDASTNQFIKVPSCTISLEHSLISIAKWEAKWHIPYLSEAPRTRYQDSDYIRCMLIGNNPKHEKALPFLNAIHVQQITDYINDPNTATTFRKAKETNKKEIITAEVIYARMFENNIPMECQKWHLNRLLTLIRVCNLQHAPSKKMNKKETAQWNAEQNAIRRAKLKTRG